MGGGLLVEEQLNMLTIHDGGEGSANFPSGSPMHAGTAGRGRGSGMVPGNGMRMRPMTGGASPHHQMDGGYGRGSPNAGFSFSPQQQQQQMQMQVQMQMQMQSPSGGEGDPTFGRTRSHETRRNDHLQAEVWTRPMSQGGHAGISSSDGMMGGGGVARRARAGSMQISPGQMNAMRRPNSPSSSAARRAGIPPSGMGSPGGSMNQVGGSAGGGIPPLHGRSPQHGHAAKHQQDGANRKPPHAPSNSPGQAKAMDGGAAASVLGQPLVDVSTKFMIQGEEIGRGRVGYVRVCVERATGMHFACKTIPKDRLQVGVGEEASVVLGGKQGGEGRWAVSTVLMLLRQCHGISSRLCAGMSSPPVHPLSSPPHQFYHIFPSQEL